MIETPRDSGRHAEHENSRSEVEAGGCQSGGAAASPNPSIPSSSAATNVSDELIVWLEAIREVLREAHFALDDSEDRTDDDPRVYHVPDENVMALHKALKACEAFATEDDDPWYGPGPLVTRIIERLRERATLSPPLPSLDVGRLREALEPFAKLASDYDGPAARLGVPSPYRDSRVIRTQLGACRRARAALSTSLPSPLRHD